MVFINIQEHYGSKDEKSVNIIKQLFTELELPQLYSEYEEESYQQICKLINKLENRLEPRIFQGFMAKIYKRKL